MRFLQKKMSSNIITTADAYEMYLAEGYQNLMPFNSTYEHDFLEYLGNRGIVVIDDEEINCDNQ